MRAAALLLLLGTAAVIGVSAQARKETPPFVAATLNDLKPVELEQRTRAEFFQAGWLQPVLLPTILNYGEPERVPFYTPPEEATPTFILRKKICGSTAVLVGQPLTARPFLNKDENFLFTDFTVFVERWIRGPGGKPPILVSMLGGRAFVKEKSLKLEHLWGHLLEVGQRYVMFLGPIPKTRGYKPTAYPMVVAGDKVAGTVVDRNPELKPLQPFLDELATLASECKSG